MNRREFDNMIKRNKPKNECVKANLILEQYGTIYCPRCDSNMDREKKKGIWKLDCKKCNLEIDQIDYIFWTSYHYKMRINNAEHDCRALQEENRKLREALKDIKNISKKKEKFMYRRLVNIEAIATEAIKIKEETP